MAMALTLFVLVVIGLMVAAFAWAIAVTADAPLFPPPPNPVCPFCRIRPGTVEPQECPADDTVQCRCCHTCVAANCRGTDSTTHQEAPPCQ